MATSVSAKSYGAMKTISEVADIVGLPAHVLRFWETKFAQIQPLKRGGGRRFYRSDDVEALLLIKELLHQRNYTIKGAAKLLPELLLNRQRPIPDAAPEMAEPATPHIATMHRLMKVEAIAPAEDALLSGSRREALVALKRELEAIQAMLAA